MKTSREQFEEWFNRRKQAMQVAGVSRHRMAMLERRMHEEWQASRQCIEFELPFYCERYQHDEAIIDSLRAEGIKIKGA